MNDTLGPAIGGGTPGLWLPLFTQYLGYWQATVEASGFGADGKPLIFGVRNATDLIIYRGNNQIALTDPALIGQLSTWGNDFLTTLGNPQRSLTFQPTPILPNTAVITKPGQPYGQVGYVDMSFSGYLIHGKAQLVYTASVGVPGGVDFALRITLTGGEDFHHVAGPLPALERLTPAGILKPPGTSSDPPGKPGDPEPEGENNVPTWLLNMINHRG